MPRAIRFFYYLLFFFIPILISPLSFELFEFPKMLFVYLITILITTSWLIESIKQKRFIFKKTPFDLPILLFFISQLLSTAFSINTRTSLLGYYSRFNQGLFSTISYIILYYAFITFNKGSSFVKKCINLLLASASLVSIYAIFQHFGIDSNLWIQDVQNRVFSTLGQPNWLAALLIFIIFIPISSILKNSRNRTYRHNNIYYMLFTICYLAILYTKSRSGLLAFSISYAIFWALILYIHKLKSFPWKSFLTISSMLFAICLFDGLKWIPQINKIYSKTSPLITENRQLIAAPGGTESGDIRKIVWAGAFNVWKHYPILGSGVETFAYSYYQFRPIEHNLVSEWDFVYNKAHNEYLNFLATTGLVGLITYLSIQVTFIYWLLKQISSNKPYAISHMLSALLAGYASLAVTNFFGFATVLTSMLFFLLPAMAISLNQESRIKNQESKSNLLTHQKITILFIIFTSCFFILRLAQWAIADSYFAQGSRRNDLNKLQKAHRLMPKEPDFTAALAETSALEYLNQQNKVLGEQAIVLAETVKSQNPVHLKFVKSYVRVYLTLSQVNPAFLNDAAQELIRGTQLSPTDPKLRYNLGLIYIQLENPAEAEKHLKAAITLKPNYDTARYALGMFYENQNQIQKAREQYQYILDFISPQNQNVLDRLKNLTL